MPWRKTFETLVAFGLIAVGPAPAADTVAAHVVKLSHQTAKYQVLRDKHALPITYNMSLRNGDVVVVIDAAAVMGLRYVDSRTVDVTKASSPYIVLSKATKPEVTSNFLMTLWQNVTKAQNAGFRSTSTRDVDPGAVSAGLDRQALSLGIPGLADASAQIAAGDRHLLLRWSGGRAPYRVVVRGGEGKVLVDEANIPTRVLAIGSHTVHFAPGAYRFEVTDGAGASVQGGFSAIEGLRVPTPDAGGDAVDAATQTAALLAAGDDPSRYYEAYLQLYATLGANWGPAEALAAWLAEGAPK